MTWKEAGYPSNAFTLGGTTYIITNVDHSLYEEVHVVSIADANGPTICWNMFGGMVIRALMKDSWLTAIMLDYKIIVIE